jgi:ferrous iron transport protein B
MKKILLMGHPNVGKSVFFNRLTGAHVIESNYPGTTVDYTKGYMKLDGEDTEVMDVPGTFSLKARDKAEEVATKMLEENKDAYIVCVLDASKIERGLYLVFEIAERNYPIVLALNMWDVAKEKEIKIDTGKLEKILGIPVIPTVAVEGKGMKNVISRLKEANQINIDKIKEGLKEVV